MRRRILVNSRFQFVHVLNILFITGAGSLLLSFLAAWLFLGFFDQRLEMCGIHDGFFVFLGAAIIVVVSGIIWSFYYTRNIAGQMKKISVLLENAAKDEIPEKDSIKFRDNDSFKWIASSLEACFDNIRSKKETLERLKYMKKRSACNNITEDDITYDV